MKRIALICLLVSIALIASADQFRSIDGFTVTTSADVEIGYVEGPGGFTSTIWFIFDGNDEPDVLARFERSPGQLRPSDMVVVNALTFVRSLPRVLDDMLESITASPYITPSGVEGTWIAVRSATGYHDAFAIQIDPPGRTFWSIVIAPLAPGDEGRRHIDRVLEGLEIVMEDAAG